MKKNIYVFGLSVVAFLPLAQQAFAQTVLSTTTLGAAIDTISGSTYDYFTVMIAKFWPYLLVTSILVGVVVYGKRIIHAIFGR